jgi:hypothetical protein
MKRSVFWDITSCSLVNISRHFGGMSPPFSWMKSKPGKNTSMKQVDFLVTRQCCIPDDRALQCESDVSSVLMPYRCHFKYDSNRFVDFLFYNVKQIRYWFLESYWCFYLLICKFE